MSMTSRLLPKCCHRCHSAASIAIQRHEPMYPVASKRAAADGTQRPPFSSASSTVMRHSSVAMCYRRKKSRAPRPTTNQEQRGKLRTWLRLELLSSSLRHNRDGTVMFGSYPPSSIPSCLARVESCFSLLSPLFLFSSLSFSFLLRSFTQRHHLTTRPLTPTLLLPLFSPPTRSN